MFGCVIFCLIFYVWFGSLQSEEKPLSNIFLRFLSVISFYLTKVLCMLHLFGYRENRGKIENV